MKVLSAVLCLACLQYAAADLPSLVDLLGQLNGTSTVLQLVAQAGLTDQLRDQGPYTLFVPTDSAFAKLPPGAVNTQDPKALADILQYHMVNGEIFAWDLKSREHLTSVNGHIIRVYQASNGGHYFNQAMAVKEMLQASNGVIYLIDETLELPEGTIYQILGNPDYNLTEFQHLVDASGQARRLNSTTSLTRYTVFAPINSAINSLSPSVLNRIKGSSTYARLLVEYHEHTGTVHAQSLGKPGSFPTTYPGHYIGLTIDSNNNTILNNVATVLIKDIEAENGVVHVISHVLIPSSLAPVVG